MGFRKNRVKRRLGIPRDVDLVTWTVADYRGMRVPGPPLVGVAYAAAYLGLTDGRLWLTKAGALRQFDVRDMVMVSTEERPRGAIRIDFRHGEPLVVVVADDGRFARELGAQIAVYDRQLQMDAEAALGLPDRSPDLVARAELARRRSEQLTNMAGTDRFVRKVAEGLVDEERELLHEAQVQALRQLRSALLATQLTERASN